jgi:hypothetical protein
MNTRSDLISWKALNSNVNNKQLRRKRIYNISMTQAAPPPGWRSCYHLHASFRTALRKVALALRHHAAGRKEVSIALAAVMLALQLPVHIRE